MYTYPDMYSKQTIPPIFEHLVCSCTEPDKVSYSFINGEDRRSWIQKMYETGMSIDDRIARIEPLGMYCKNCLKPVGFTIFHAVRVCEGCDTYYVPKPVKGTYPIRYFLCEKCDVPTRLQRKAKS